MEGEGYTYRGDTVEGGKMRRGRHVAWAVLVLVDRSQSAFNTSKREVREIDTSQGGIQVVAVSVSLGANGQQDRCR